MFSTNISTKIAEPSKLLSLFRPTVLSAKPAFESHKTVGNFHPYRRKPLLMPPIRHGYIIQTMPSLVDTTSTTYATNGGPSPPLRHPSVCFHLSIGYNSIQQNRSRVAVSWPRLLKKDKIKLLVKLLFLRTVIYNELTNGHARSDFI